MQVGWDWASETHDVTVMDSAGQVIDHWSLDHDEAGLDQAIGRLASHGRPEALPLAIETTNGMVVDRLLAAGHPVVPIHPNAFNATRPRWGAARAKSDPGDSWKLADYLRTDGHRLHRLKPLSAATRHLQALSRLRDDHLEAKTAATNQLGVPLDAHWPGAKAIFARLASAIALAFLERYPPRRQPSGSGRHAWPPSCGATPTAATARQRRCWPACGPLPSQSIALDPKVLATCVGAQVKLLWALLAAIADLDQALRTALDAHPKTAVLAPMPPIGQINLAQILAEVGPILDRASNPEHAAAEAGASPVTKQSGKTTSVHFRWAANTRARHALATFADNSRHASPWAASLYANTRRRGKRHPKPSAS